jgi:hypothetical protein
MRACSAGGGPTEPPLTDWRGASRAFAAPPRAPQTRTPRSTHPPAWWCRRARGQQRPRRTPRGGGTRARTPAAGRVAPSCRAVPRRTNADLQERSAAARARVSRGMRAAAARPARVARRRGGGSERPRAASRGVFVAAGVGIRSDTAPRRFVRALVRRTQAARARAGGRTVAAPRWVHAGGRRRAFLLASLHAAAAVQLSHVLPCVRSR